MPSPPVWTIVVAAGSGLRFGERKQFAELGGRSVLQHAIDAASGVSDGVVIVVPGDAVNSHGAVAPDDVELIAVVGGATRAESVRAGLAVVPEACAVVLVHDAARPMASPALFSTVVESVFGGAGAVVPAVPIVDTVRHVTDGVIDRSDLVAVQTPQGFAADVLRSVHRSGRDATDDASLVEGAGYTVHLIEGEIENRKITDAIDLVTASAILEARRLHDTEEARQ